MKGAAKKPKKEKEKHHRKAKPSADQMSELYSESQRMLRDSRVNLPYYEPEAKSLDDFLARASQKRQEYSSLHRPKDIEKALIIHEKLSVRLPQKNPHAKSKKEKSTSDDCMATLESQKPFSGDVNALSAICSDSAVDSQNTAASQTSALVIDSSQDDDIFQREKYPSSQGLIQESNTELPDLDPVQVTDASLLKGNNGSVTRENDHSVRDTPVITTEESSMGDVVEKVPILKVIELKDKYSIECSISHENHVDELEPPALLRDPSRDLFGSLSAEEQLEDESAVERNVIGTNQAPCEQTKTISSGLEFPGSQDKTPVKHNTEEEKSEKGSNTESENLSKSAKKDHSKLDLLHKLQQQGVSLPIVPKLSGTPDSIIMLEDDKSSEKPKNAGVLKLMDRLIQHSAKRKPRPAYDINLSIVEKEGEDGEKRELKLKSVSYHVEEEKEDIPTTTSGSKLLILKEQLNKGMKQRREEARMRKEQMYNLENEEGYENMEDNGEEEEEDEITEESDSEEEDDEDDVMDMAVDDMMEDDGKDYNPLLDTEAKEDDEEDEGSVNGYSNFDEESNDVPLRLELSEDDEDDEEPDEDTNIINNIDEDGDEEDDNDSGITKLKRTKNCKSQILLSDSEDEEVRDVLDNGQRLQASASHNDKEDSVSLCDTWRDDLVPSASHIPNKQFRRENSQSPELYGPSTLDDSECSSTMQADNLDDSISSFNPHSQLLDADGYLKTTQTHKPRSRIGQLVNAVEDDTTALDIFESTGKVSAGKIFGGLSSQAASQDDNMAELMGLCSGKFQTNQDSDSELNPSQKRNTVNQEDYGEDLDCYDPFHVLSDDEGSKNQRHKNIKPVLSDNDDGEDSVNQDLDNDHGITKVGDLLRKSRKRFRREFFEDEAELSGSEFDSDENVDLDEEDDILEEEEGDKDMAGVSTEVLRDQVGRVHMKQLQDEDDREVMRFKEMYLQDGDLYGEGGGRIRNFRWKDIDESSQQDMFGHGSDDEAEEEDKDDLKWRQERYEREKFIEESEQVGGNSEGSQLVKFGQLFLKRQDSSSHSERSQDQSQKTGDHKKSSVRQMKLKGSFLARGKEALVKIAHVAKTALGGKSGHSSRNFLFQSIESQNIQDDQEESEPIQNPGESAKRKAHSNVHTMTVTKKSRISKSDSQGKPSVRRQNSIFNLLNK